MAQIQAHLLRFRNRPVDAVSDVPAYLKEVREAARRRRDYDLKLLTAAKEDKKKKAQEKEADDENEEIPVAADAAAASAASAESDEKKNVTAEAEEPEQASERDPVALFFASSFNLHQSLSQSVQSLSTAALESQVQQGLRKRNKKKKNKPAQVALNQTQ